MDKEKKREVRRLALVLGLTLSVSSHQGSSFESLRFESLKGNRGGVVGEKG
jgi:hypothetical protein